MRVSDERLAELREKHLRDAARLSRHEVLADPHRDLAALLAELQEHRAREEASEWGFGVNLGFGAVREHSRRDLAEQDARTTSTATYPDGRVEEHMRSLMRRLVGPWEPVTGEQNNDE